MGAVDEFSTLGSESLLALREQLQKEYLRLQERGLNLDLTRGKPSVVAPVLSQPSLPLGSSNPERAAGIGASKGEIACAKRRFDEEGLSMIGLRFFDDPFVPDARFETLKREFGDKFEAIEIDPKDAAPGPLKHPHSVLTVNLAESGPTKAAEQRVIAFFKERTGA